MSARIPNEPHKAVLLTAVGTTVLIAVGAFILSFAALTDLAERSGIEAHLAWIWPIIVDGMIVASTVAIVALNGHDRRAMIYPWTLLFFGAIVSTAANSVHAILTVDNLQSGIPALVSALVAAMPPVVLLAITHLTVHMYQKRAEVAQLHDEQAAREQASYAPMPAPTLPMQGPEDLLREPTGFEALDIRQPTPTAPGQQKAIAAADRLPATVPAAADEGPAPLYEETVQALSPDKTQNADARLHESVSA